MLRRAVGCRWFMLAVSLSAFGSNVAPARAAEDPRTVCQFLQQLKNHGLHDIALDYIRDLRADPALPNDLKTVLDYEEGRTLIDEASSRATWSCARSY